MGRLPTRSDKTPSTGENKNCISAQAVLKMPRVLDALDASPPRKFRISFGKTGAIRPNASMSSVTVMKIKVTAALRGFMLLPGRPSLKTSAGAIQDPRLAPRDASSLCEAPGLGV